MIFSSGAGLTSEIDELALDIDSEGLVVFSAFQMALAGSSTATMYTFTPPAAFTGDCVVSFQVLCPVFRTNTNTHGGWYLFATAKRISGTWSVPSGASAWSAGSAPSTSGSMTLAPTVSGSSILLRITNIGVHSHTIAGTVEIFGMRIP